MCLYYGLRLWWKHKGRLLVVFQPGPHVLNIGADGIVRHGTCKVSKEYPEYGHWRIDTIPMDQFRRWICQP